MFQRRRLSAERADSLQRALSTPDASGEANGRNGDFLELAQMLRPGASQSEAHRALVRDRLFRSHSPEQRADAGSRDGHDARTLHALEVGAPEGGTIRVADIEPLDADRLSRVMQQLAEIAAEETGRVNHDR